MKNNLLNLATAVLVSGLAISATGCKEDTILKAGIAPASDNIFSNAIGDTLTIYATTVFDDSTATGFTPTSGIIYHGVGTSNDAFFGRSNFGIYMQLLPTASNLSLPTTPDSAVLILPYSGFSWGDTSNKNAIEEFEVYRLTEDISKDTAYYSKQYKNVDWSNPLSESNSINLYNLKDSVMVNGTNKAPHMRIKLKTAFMNELLTIAKNANNNSEFVTAMKGIYVVAKDTNNNTIKTIPYISLTGSTDYTRAGIAFYYKENGGVSTNFLNFSSTDCAHFNRITRNYNGYPAYPFITKTTGQLSDSIILLQNEPGAAIDIRIPYLKYLPKAIINKAQLVITKVSVAGDPDGDKMTEPTRMFPVGIDKTGKAYSILDREPSDDTAPIDFIDGVKRTLTVNGITITQWYINIPREVQKTIINNSDELHLRINGTITYPGAYRLIAGGKHSAYKIRLNITYSQVN